MRKTQNATKAQGSDSRKWLDRPLSISILAGAVLLTGTFAFASTGDDGAIPEPVQSIEVPMTITDGISGGAGANPSLNLDGSLTVESEGFGSLPE